MKVVKSTGRRISWAWLMALPLLLTACLPEGVRVQQSPLLKDIERKSGLIVYVGTDGNIYTIDQGGSNRKAVISDAQLPDGPDGKVRYYRSPVWSPDSRRLAFVGVSGTGDTLESASIYTALPDGADLVEVFTSNEEFPFYLYWAPDSEDLSFLTTAVSGRSMILQMVDAQGGEVQVLDAGQPYYWAWAPDGQTILVNVGRVTDSQPRARLSFLSLEDEVIEERLDLHPTRFQAPAWSPDGEQLLLASETEGGEGALLLTDRQGRAERALTTFDGSVAFAWSPDGEQVAYIVSDTWEEAGVFGRLVALDPEKPDEIKTVEEEPVIAFFWSPNSRKIAYFVPLVVSPTPGPDDQTDAIEQVEVLLRLGVLDARSGKARYVMTFRPTLDFLGILPYFDQYQHSATIWSPDSENLVLSAYDSDGEPVIWVVAASGNLTPRAITDGLLASWSWE